MVIRRRLIASFGDGSVKFIKTSIDSWKFKFNPSSEWSPCLGWNPVTQVYFIKPGARVGVWQTLSNRAGGECVGGVNTDAARMDSDVAIAIEQRQKVRAVGSLAALEVTARG